MSNSPLVSVVLPTYNRSGLVNRSIRSVLEQSLLDLELVVVDDGSTDGTQDEVLRISDSRVRLIRHAKNAGAAAARNTGMSAARGKYIAFQDSDVIWMPDKLRLQIECIEAAPDSVGLVYTALWKQRKGRLPNLLIPRPDDGMRDGNVVQQLAKQNFVDTPAVLMRSSCVSDDLLFDTTLDFLEDWELWLRVAKKHEFRFIPSPMLISLHSPGGVNDQPDAVTAQTLSAIIRKHMDVFDKMPDVLTNYYRRIGCHYLAAGESERAERFLREVVIRQPGRFRNRLLHWLSRGAGALGTIAMRVYWKTGGPIRHRP